MVLILPNNKYNQEILLKYLLIMRLNFCIKIKNGSIWFFFFSQNWQKMEADIPDLRSEVEGRLVDIVSTTLSHPLFKHKRHLFLHDQTVTPLLSQHKIRRLLCGGASSFRQFPKSAGELPADVWLPTISVFKPCYFFSSSSSCF